MNNWIGLCYHSVRILLALLICGLLPANMAHAQLRIVSYNTLGGPRPGTETILRAIGEESRNGIAKPIDVLLFQEHDQFLTDTTEFVTLLNNMYGAGVYARGDVVGGPTFSGSIHQTIVFNTQTVELIEEQAFGNVSGSTNQERQTLRYQLRPVGYGSDADFYAYNSHYKASQDDSAPGPNANQRNAEAIAIRANFDTLEAGSQAIYAGDHNFYYADDREPGVATLTASGAGMAVDPLNAVGNWHISFALAPTHTQSPCFSGCPSGFATGGMDDRFDFQWVTEEFLDGEGLSYIGPTSTGLEGLQHSYHAFGNGGNICCNSNINIASNSVTFPGVTSYTKQQILDALFNSSDHLPVVVDYQVPAILEAVAGSYPTTLNVGEEFNLELMVQNSANVVAELGADELDYSLSVMGDIGGLIGSSTGMDQALGAANLHQVALDTSTPGLKSGTILVTSDSPGVAIGMVSFDIMFEVVAAGLAGDYNGNGVVDAADYTKWRDTFGQTGSTLAADGTGPEGAPDGVVDQLDYDFWKLNFGQSAGNAAGSSLAARELAAVPEPATVWLLMLAVIGICVWR